MLRSLIDQVSATFDHVWYQYNHKIFRKELNQIIQRIYEANQFTALSWDPKKKKANQRWEQSALWKLRSCIICIKRKIRAFS